MNTVKTMGSREPSKRSIIADPAKLHQLRVRLGWTQETAAFRTSYSERLIRKLETGTPVRPKTLQEILQIYHQDLGIDDWQLESYLMQDRSSGTSEGGADEMKAIATIREFFETVYNQRCTSWIDESVSEAAILKSEAGDRIGRAAFKELAQTILNGFCPIEFQIEQAYSNGSDVVICWHARMKHVGEFLDVPASQNWVETRGASVAIVQDGMILEGDDKWDIDQLIRQLKGKELRPNP